MVKIFVSIVVLILVIGGGLLLFGSSDTTPDLATTSTSNSTSVTPESTDNLVQAPIEGGGLLTEYDPKALADSDADTNIIFFHASWCVVCNSVERNLLAGNIPEGMVIYKVDYESSVGRDLADKYNIPIQYTMVQVDQSGTEITQWVNQAFFTIEDIIEKVQQI